MTPVQVALDRSLFKKVLLFKWAKLQPLFVNLQPNEKNYKNQKQKISLKYPGRELNSQPFDGEYPPLTTRPGLPQLFFKVKSSKNVIVATVAKIF